MVAFHISTQVLENYGAHCDSGRYSRGQHYWKMKGGEDYIITGLERIQDAVAFVAALATENGLGYKEFPCDWREVDADFQTDFERSQLEWDGEVRFPAKRIDVPEFFRAREAERSA